MTLITDLPLLGAYDGSEAFVVSKGGTEYHVLGGTITAEVAADLAAYIVSNNIVTAALDADKLDIAGGTMTGYLVLNADPVSNLQAATKQYVDGLLAGKVDNVGGTLDVSTTGATAGNTVEDLSIATTEFVANKIEYEVLSKKTINAASATLVYADRGTIAVDYTATSAVVINLPNIAALASAVRTEYYIVDTGNNAGTNTITINAFAGNTVDGANSITIESNGESVLLFTKGGTSWYVKDKVIEGSTTKPGIVRLATSGETIALASNSIAVTPGSLASVLDDKLYKITEIGTAFTSVNEGDAGSIYYVSYTNTGAATITLPAAAGLANPSRFVIEVWDIGLASVNNITILTAGGNIDGAASFLITDTKSGLKIVTNGVNYFTVNNTARATATIGIGAPNLAAVLAAGNGTGAFDILVAAGQSIKHSNSGFTASVIAGTLAGNVTITLPSATGTLATLEANQTFTGDITFDNNLRIPNNGYVNFLADGTIYFAGFGSTNFIQYAAGDITMRSGTLTLVSTTYVQLQGDGLLDDTKKQSSTNLVNMTGAGAINTVYSRVRYTSTGTGEVLTLAPGADGQIMEIFYVAEGAGADTGVITPSAPVGFTSITLTDVGSTAMLRYYSGYGWFILSTIDCVIV